MKNELKQMRIVVGVVVFYLITQVIADITAFKMVEIFGMVVPGGTLVYALTFTSRDLAHKQIGYKATQFLILATVLANILMVAVFYVSVKQPHPVWWEFQDAYATVLGLLPRITAASVLAELLAQLSDTFVYQKIWDKYPKAPQWVRVMASNLVSIPIDSVLFAFVAFGGIMTMTELSSMIAGQIVLKSILGVISTPLIYVIPTKKAK